MGEAMQRRATGEDHGVTDKEALVIQRVARRLHRSFAVEGACYRVTLFLRYHLARAHGIRGEAVIGYVNDGTDDLYSSHAWFEHRGLMTDVALCRPLEPRLQKRGAVLVGGKEVVPGWAFTYHRERPAGALTVVSYDELHTAITGIAEDEDAIRAYLDGAPDGIGYTRMAALVR